jgi:hypothetical protein
LGDRISGIDGPNLYLVIAKNGPGQFIAVRNNYPYYKVKFYPTVENMGITMTEVREATGIQGTPSIGLGYQRLTLGSNTFVKLFRFLQLHGDVGEVISMTEMLSFALQLADEFGVKVEDFDNDELYDGLSDLAEGHL